MTPEPLEISTQNVQGIILWSKGRTSSKMDIQGCTDGDLTIGVGDGGEGAGRAHAPKIREKIFFRQLLCKIWALFGQKSCKIGEFC